MKSATIIIGANFGDEGKGLMTDYFASSMENALVVRFNGGAQAGHTVVKDGKRFIFSHFGSGTLVGVPTYYAKEFFVNPLLFNKEYDELVGRGVVLPDHWFHPECHITTPYDIIINQEIEKFRGIHRHGSCGVGIQETWKRSAVYPITMRDLEDTEHLWKQMEEIREKWIDERAKFLGMAERLPDFVYDDRIIEGFIKECEKFKDRYYDICDDKVLDYFDNIIFEGAQGLLLDQYSKYFPYVTPSSTGLENVVAILKDFEPVPTEVIYMTRCYMTRHGAGPFESECEKPYPGIVDLTNKPNEWQQNLRFGYLDVNLLKETIEKDWKFALPHFQKNLAITCLDQTEEHIIEFDKHKFHMSELDLIYFLRGELKVSDLYTSHSDDGTKIKKKVMYNHEKTQNLLDYCDNLLGIDDTGSSNRRSSNNLKT